MLLPAELKSKMQGVFHMVMTHFDEEGDVDTEAIRQSVRAARDAFRGEDVVFVTTATTGEFYALSDDELITVVRTVADEIGGTFPVLAGTARAGTRWTSRLSRRAQEAGADGVLVLNPYYQFATEDGLVEHFSEIASAIDIGLMIYNNPLHTKLWINPGVMQRLARIEHVVAVKENTADVGKFFFMQRAVDPTDLVVICGLGHLMYPFASLFGCPGFYSPLGNFAPDYVLAVYHSYVERDFERLRELTNSAAPYFEFLGRVGKRHGDIPTVISGYMRNNAMPVYQSVVKQAMELVGLPGGKVRAPVDNITAEEREELSGVLNQCFQTG